MRRPRLVRSIRFRLTVLYSTLLFALTGAALAITYVAVAQTTEAAPLTTREAKLYEGHDFVGRVSYADISQIEAAVNYDTLQYLRTYSLLALGGLFLASLGIGWVLSGRALRPVGAITRTTKEIQATDLTRRIRLAGPRDELRDLADTIDSMLDRLDAAFQAQRQLIDDASHELRSPLAIIRTHLDATLTAPEATAEERERAVTVVDRATTRMTRLVEDLLASARRAAGGLNDTDVDLSVVAREAGDESEQPARLRYALTPGLHLIGDADALRRAVGNLLSNAVRLAAPPSTVSVRSGRTESWLWVAVTDAGPGIAEPDLTRVFDRFWRGAAPSSRERRTGLGLAIVRQIVESHGGQVAVFSTLGEGSTFVLWLPATGRTGGSPPPARNPAAASPGPATLPGKP
ncbi:cell wall metabolism sensor histidine kinase WalK [Actinoplanes sp. N902-109]|uniref:sensor histidine kinase n=1 Tax=Actinoplanes sp. (strain N902-109) TaxID=649831 RepID=UPI000329487B|nr:HAMP domain-containing sensor histidine kinase [Actinoplanes sp. N902-109]AGL20459.1 histidine kinase [Actinoplanes sp. N902-109]